MSCTALTHDLRLGERAGKRRYFLNVAQCSSVILYAGAPTVHLITNLLPI